MDLYIFSDCEFGQNLSDVWHEFEALWIGSCAPLLKGLLFSGEAGTLFSVQRACFTCTFRQFWNVFRWGNDVINAKSVSLTGSNFPLFCTHVPAPCPVPRVRCFPPARQSRLGIGVNFIRILYATLSHFIRALYASVIHSHHFSSLKLEPFFRKFRHFVTSEYDRTSILPSKAQRDTWVHAM